MPRTKNNNKMFLTILWAPNRHERLQFSQYTVGIGKWDCLTAVRDLQSFHGKEEERTRTMDVSSEIGACFQVHD